VKISNQKALDAAIAAARSAGKLMRQNLRAKKNINSESQHDIKLELDVRCQNLIERMLFRALPGVGFLGEEGGESDAEYRWVVDPIDGTVNFSYEIPHSCVSIALQKKVQGSKSKVQSANYETLAGVVYDPFCDELWTAIRGQPARLNGKIIHVSKRDKLKTAIISIGFGKSKESINATLPYLGELLRRVRKVRMMGAAALAMVYVASGRFDGYVEQHVRLWDIAAGGLILECAGGEFWNRPVEGEHAYQVLANNGLLRRQLTSLRERSNKRERKKL
jgi:myo-inositol-1(or 4)-monophosphatase